MSSQVFYRKWRPQTLSEVVGQEHVTRTLLNALSTGRISHAYLFCGPRGTGKTSTGRILAKAVNCLNSGTGEPCNECELCTSITNNNAIDVIEIDAASNTSVEDIRSLREKVGYAPNRARYKVYIIDEVHMLSNSASNALLKTLEEPPPHAIFILATTESHKVLATIMSRCQRFDFRRISQKDVIDKLASVAEAENITIDAPALQLIARSTTGSLRDAENLLEQITTFYGNEIGLPQVQSVLGISGDYRARELAQHIVNRNLAGGMAAINSVSRDGLDLRQFNRELVAYLRDLLLIKTGSPDAVDLTEEEKQELQQIIAPVSLDDIMRAVKHFGQIDSQLDSYSTLPLELALVDCILTGEEPREKPSAPVEPVREPAKAVRKPKQPEATPVQPAKKEAIPEQDAAPAEAVTKPEPVQEQPVQTPVEEAEPAIEQEVTPVPQEVSESAPASEPEPPTLEPGGDTEWLQQNWKQVMAKAPADVKKTPACALLRSGARPVEVKDATVVLSFKHKGHKEKLDEPDNKKIAERIISNFLGRECTVCCIIEPDRDHLIKEAIRLGAQITSVEEK